MSPVLLLQVSLTLEVQERWCSGGITEVGQATPPAQPSRKDTLTVLQPGKIKRGKGGTQVRVCDTNLFG